MSLLFSVITVVRNDLAGLKKTRESLEEQTYKHWVHIVIDGASGKPTQNYLKSLPEKNTIYVSERDSGIYNAMNKGWKIADPESFAYFLNARDVFADKNSLYEAANELKRNTKVKWGCTTHEEIQQDGDGWVCKLVSPPSVTNQLFAFGYRSHQAVVMKGKFIAQLGGFDERFEIAADWDLIVRAMLLEKPMIWVHSLGRFELGGASSKKLLEAHYELKTLRRKYLGGGLKKRLLDDLWCSIYLKYFGYKNYFTPILNFYYFIFGISEKKEKIRRHRRRFQGFKLNLGSLRISIDFSRTVKSHKRQFRIKSKLQTADLIFKIHRSLEILPYSTKDEV